MLKCDVDLLNGSGPPDVEMSGDSLALSGDIIYLIRTIYQRLMEEQPMTALIFRTNLRRMLSEKDSALWGPPPDDECARELLKALSELD